MKVLICDICRKTPNPEILNPRIIRVSYSTGDLSTLFTKEEPWDICDDCFREMVKYIKDNKK